MNPETVDTLDGWFKTRYADKAEMLVPEFVILPKYFKFDSAKKTGDTYQQTVRVRRQFGWTWAGSDGVSGTAFLLNDAVPGQTKPANLRGTEFVNRAQIAYGVIKRAMDSQQAFGESFDQIVQDMTESTHFARETALLYGGTNVGVVDSIAGSPTFTIEAGEWAPGLWSQMEGGWIDVYNGATQRNAVGPLVVENIDADNYSITLSGDAADLAAIVSGDQILPYKAYGEWFLGLHSIAANQGLMFGIDGANFSLWKGNIYDAGSAAATMAKFTKGVIGPVTRGGMGRICYFVSTATWADLNNDHAALRRFGESTKSGLDLGTNKITYYGPNGTIDIVPHPMVKQGYAYGLQTDKWKRVGSSDVTFELGIDGSQNRFFQQMGNNAGFEIRCYWDQALFCNAPARQTRMENISNSV